MSPPLFDDEQHPAHKPLADGWPEPAKAVAPIAIAAMLAPLCPATEEHQPHAPEHEYAQMQPPAIEFYTSASSFGGGDVTVPLTGVSAFGHVGSLLPSTTVSLITLK